MIIVYQYRLYGFAMYKDRESGLMTHFRHCETIFVKKFELSRKIFSPREWLLRLGLITPTAATVVTKYHVKRLY